MNIYAYKGDTPDEDTPLYAAPFFNVTGSSVCLGSANLEKPKDMSYEKLLQYWEKKFWLTESPTWEATETRLDQTLYW